MAKETAIRDTVRHRISGGKDSIRQVMFAKEQMGLNPLSYACLHLLNTLALEEQETLKTSSDSGSTQLSSHLLPNFGNR